MLCYQQTESPLTFALQALLARHEAYMADAELDRQRLNARIDRLQLDKQELEANNAAKDEENNELIEQLELLNTTIFDSDAKIKSLEASLLSSQQAIRRLESAAARATEADQHLRILEEEQDKLTGELKATKEEARSHAQRFKEAQRGILDMQDQLERMEKEAILERQRHDEMMEKVGRQREVEKHLDVAAVRLKGAAASKSITEHRQGNKIVGHFVRDLLQDNANLQLGIAELREMLISSNDEIQVLREQLMFHQPLTDDFSPASTLKAELEPSLFENSRQPQEFHIHHHYHVAKQDTRKPKKKRQGLLPGIFTPPAAISRSSSPGPGFQRRLVSSPTRPVLSHAGGETTPITASSSTWHEFSTPSEMSSSLPTSPRIFDHSGAETDSLMSPTTSYDPMSPTWRASHRKRASAASSCSFQSLSIIDIEPGTAGVQTQNPYRFSSGVIHEEDEDVHTSPPATATEQDAPQDEQAPEEDDANETTNAAAIPIPAPSSRLRRVASHESIMSLSGGLDIHTLQIRPSQMTLRPLGGADAVVTGVIAQPTLSTKYSKRSDAALRDNFAGFQIPKRSSTPTSDMSGSSSQTSRNGAGGLGKWVGWRPWGGAGAVSQSLPRAAEKAPPKPPNRAPGINQPGAIPGFQEYWISQQRKGAPSRAAATAETIDNGSLS